jgi:hypothetical protein
MKKNRKKPASVPPSFSLFLLPYSMIGQPNIFSCSEAKKHDLFRGESAMAWPLGGSQWQKKVVALASQFMVTIFSPPSHILKML